MAPGYRAQNRNRNRTGYVDHDVFEGLPVRHWRRDYVTVAPPPTQESTTSQNDIWAIELPHGMPKDSHLLPQHSQDLLRAARSGRIYKRPAPAEEEEADPEAILGDKPEKKEDDPKDRGFSAKAWKQIPRHLEGPDIEYLAKRRKGLITLSAKAATAGPTLTKTTVKRIDAAGNEYVQDVVVPHGQQVEGEVISQTTIPDPAAVDGYVQPTPPKRKGPIIRKKPKGPGRGRKKKPAAPTSVPDAALVGGAVAQTGEGTDGAAGPDGIKTENDGGAPPSTNEDTEMGDGSVVASGDDDGEDGEDSEDGDEDEVSVDNQGSPSKPPRQLSADPILHPTMTETPNLLPEDTGMTGVETPLSQPAIITERDRHEGKSGSPLKNVVLTTSSVTSPLESPTSGSAAPFSDPDPIQPPQPALITEPALLNETMQEVATETAPTSLPPPPPQPTEAEAEAAVEERREEEDEEEMLLDIEENANSALVGGGDEPPYEQAQPLADGAPKDAQAVATEASPEVESTKTEIAEAPEVSAEQPEQIQEEQNDDDFPDLLGGLEKSLEKQHQTAANPEVEERKTPSEKPADSEANTLEKADAEQTKVEGD